MIKKKLVHLNEGDTFFFGDQTITATVSGWYEVTYQPVNFEDTEGKLPKNLSTVVAKEDKLPGCPVTRWDGPYSFRCGLGIIRCAIHGDFDTQIITPREF